MEYWVKQTVATPLFPELEWEKPERKDQAGRLMILGGNLHGFSSVASADQIAKQQGIGSTRILLPDALRRTLAPLWTDAIFCPSTSTGSFSKDATDLVLQNALSADGILISGDLGRNSETAVLLDTLLRSYKGPITITRDALDYYLERPKDIFNRESAIIVGSFSQFQKLLGAYGYTEPFVFTMPIASLAGTLSRFSSLVPAMIITRHEQMVFVALGGKVSSTRMEYASEIWRLEHATKSIVSILHHPAKIFEAATMSQLPLSS